MAGSLQREQEPLDQEIARELLALAPERWGSVVLELRYRLEDGIERFAHVISSPEGHPEPITPSDHLFDITFRLREVFKKHGRPWTRVSYRVDVNEDGGASYAAKFEY